MARRRHNALLRSRELEQLHKLSESPYQDNVSILSIFNNGEHYRVECCGMRFDYWPSTGRWTRMPVAHRSSTVGYGEVASSGIRGLVQWAQKHPSTPDAKRILPIPA